MTTSILIIINVFSAAAIIVLALMQQGKSDMGSAFGGGGSQSMFGSRGSSNFLSRLTSIMCTIFFVSSLALAYVYSKRSESNSVLQQPAITEQIESTETAAPSEVPAVPVANDVPAVPEVPQTEDGLPKMSVETPESRETKVPEAPQN